MGAGHWGGARHGGGGTNGAGSGRRRRRSTAVVLLLLLLLLLGCAALPAIAQHDAAEAATPAAAGLPQPPARAWPPDTTAGDPAGGQAAAAAAAAQALPRVHIVRLRYQPVSSYAGGVGGLAATAAAEGGKLEAHSGPAETYRRFLRSRAASVAASAGAGEVLRTFTNAFPGLAVAGLSDAQAARLAAHPDVAAVTLDRAERLQTITTPAFLGLAGRGVAGSGGGSGVAGGGGGVWQRFAGAGGGDGAMRAGDRVVIGVLDSGFADGAPSFSDRKGLGSKGAFNYSAPGRALFAGTCAAGENFTSCNRKVVGCRYYTTGTAAYMRRTYPGEILSCRDVTGHGTHTASTAAGNLGPQYQPGLFLSGMAPRARIAVYKVCWGTGGSCPAVSILSAIDDAISDGVDIISYSIGGSSTVGRDISLAFMGAARAGIFVAAAAGNGGPGAGTVNNVAPWVTTVAASTHSRRSTVALTLADGTTLRGAGLHAAGAGPAPLVLAERAAAAAASASDAQLCQPGALSPAKVAGRIVVCDRGVVDRSVKSKAVADAGGVGMVLLNTPAQTADVMAEFHVVPTVHLQADARAAVRAAAASGAAAALSPAATDYGAEAPLMAQFSSRGPAQGPAAALLKPDLTAPGLDVLAAAPGGGGGGGALSLAVMSGTSMSTPHVAGLAALLKQANPFWSPMAIKSALMTTAYTATVAGPSPGQPFGDAFDYGAGHVDPTRMFNPGLIFESNGADWTRLLCALDRGAVPKADAACAACAASPSACRPEDFNAPSIALPSARIGEAATAVRRVRNVLPAAARFTAVFAAEPPGGAPAVEVSVSPPSFTLAAGATRRVTVSVQAREGAPLGVWVFGAITWTSDAGTAARVPVAAKFARLLDAPRSLDISPDVSREAGGTALASVAPGFTGTLSVDAHGLAAPAVLRGDATQGAAWMAEFEAPADTVSVVITVAAKASAAPPPPPPPSDGMDGGGEQTANHTHPSPAPGAPNVTLGPPPPPPPDTGGGGNGTDAPPPPPDTGGGGGGSNGTDAPPPPPDTGGGGNGTDAPPPPPDTGGGGGGNGTDGPPPPPPPSGGGGATNTASASGDPGGEVELSVQLLRGGEAVASSAGPGASAQLTLDAPQPGTYTLAVAASAAAGGADADADAFSFTVRVWCVTRGAPRPPSPLSLDVSPAVVDVSADGGAVPLLLQFNPVPATSDGGATGGRLLGVLRYQGLGRQLGSTLVWLGTDSEA